MTLRKELKRDFMCVLLQFLKDEKLIESQHKVEQESGCYFNLPYFEEKATLGEWDEAETYISGFTKMEDNDGSKEIFLHIRTQKYLEAIHRKDTTKALDILTNELKALSPEKFNELTLLLPVQNSWEDDVSSARVKVLARLKQLIGENPCFVDKMDFPNIEIEKLFELINKSSFWQLQSGKNSKETLDLAIEPLAEYKLPLKVANTCNLSDEVTHMDFHPSHQAILLDIGCLTGKIYLWDIASDDRWFYPFEIWITSPMYSDLKDEAISVTQVAWSPDEKFFGVSFSKKLVQIYLYEYSDNPALRYVEFEGHLDRVCDLAFCHQNERVRIVTCGDDGVVKVWQLKRKHEAPEELCRFREHTDPVESLCIHKWNDSQVVFSTDSFGVVKVWPVWILDGMKSISTFDTGFLHATFCSTSDSSRIFSCGILDDAHFLVEWNVVNQSLKSVKTVYADLGELRFRSFVPFHTSGSRFLAAGLEDVIKFWDVDYSYPVATLQGQFLFPRLRFRDGNLLAATLKKITC